MGVKDAVIVSERQGARLKQHDIADRVFPGRRNGQKRTMISGVANSLNSVFGDGGTARSEDLSDVLADAFRDKPED